MFRTWYKIKMVDVNESEAMDFKIIDDHTILAPFNAVPGLGDNAAKQIVAARAEQSFFQRSCNTRKVSQTIMEYFENNGVLEGCQIKINCHYFSVLIYKY